MTTPDLDYPTIYAIDTIRMLMGYNQLGATKITKEDAAKLLVFISNILELDEYEVQMAIANHYLKNKKTIIASHISDVIKENAFGTEEIVVETEE